MKYKYNKNLDLFIRHSKTLSDGRVDLNGALNRKNYGNRRMGNTGICVWTDSIYSDSKTNK